MNIFELTPKFSSNSLFRNVFTKIKYIEPYYRSVLIEESIFKTGTFKFRLIQELNLNYITS